MATANMILLERIFSVVQCIWGRTITDKIVHTTEGEAVMEMLALSLLPDFKWSRNLKNKDNNAKYNKIKQQIDWLKVREWAGVEILGCPIARGK